MHGRGGVPGLGCYFSGWSAAGGRVPARRVEVAAESGDLVVWLAQMVAAMPSISGDQSR